MEIQKVYASGGVPTPDQLQGLGNLAQTLGAFIGQMAQNPADKPRVKEYEDAFTKLMDHLKGLEQHLQQSMKAQAGAQQPNGADPKDAAKVQAMLIQAQTKAQIAENSAQSRTRQKEQQFQLAEKRKNQELAATITRDGIEARHGLMVDRMKALDESQTAANEPESAEK